MSGKLGQPTTTVLLSGGMDSAACLGFYIDQGVLPSAVFVGYGQPAEHDEEKASHQVAAFYDVALTAVTYRPHRKFAAGYIPHRNAFLVACGLMELGDGRGVLAIGVHEGSSYPDCEPQFLEAVQRMSDVTTGGRISIQAPFLAWSKPSVLGLCDRLEVPLNLTWSCENRGPLPCGGCASCIDRGLIDA